MKIIVIFENQDYVTRRNLSLKNEREYFDTYIKNECTNLLYDNEIESIYYEVELPFLPQIGQIVGTRIGNCKVTYNSLSLEDDKSTLLYDKTFIIVKEL